MNDKIIDAVAEVIREKVQIEYPNGLDAVIPDASYPEAAKAAIEAYQQAQWQPIESAPKDEDTDILVMSKQGYAHTAHYGWEDYGIHYWFNGDVAVEPTHWMPMPELPKMEKEDAEKL